MRPVKPQSRHHVIRHTSTQVKPEEKERIKRHKEQIEFQRKIIRDEYLNK